MSRLTENPGWHPGSPTHPRHRRLPAEAAPAGGAALLGDVKSEDITSLIIRDDQGASVRLVKQAGGWVLADAGDFPADSAKITPVLAKLVAVKTNRLATQTAGSHARLQVADDQFARRLEIATAGGSSQTFFIGASAGGTSSYVRVGGKDAVYIAGDLASYQVNAAASSWIDPLYLSVTQADVVAVTLSNANGQWSFAKDAQGAWTMAGLADGEAFNAGNFTSILSLATSVQMTQPLGKTEQPDYGMAKPGAVISLQTRKDNQDKVYTLTVGAKSAADSSYVVKSSESPYYVRVAEYGVKDLVERTRQGFLQATYAGAGRRRRSQ